MPESFYSLGGGIFVLFPERKKKELHVSFRVFTPNTAKKALMVSLHDIRTVSVLYYKARMSHLLMFKIHQDLQVN